jgi:uncharacterized protein YukE
MRSLPIQKRQRLSVHKTLWRGKAAAHYTNPQPLVPVKMQQLVIHLRETADQLQTLLVNGRHYRDQSPYTQQLYWEAPWCLEVRLDF